MLLTVAGNRGDKGEVFVAETRLRLVLVQCASASSVGLTWSFFFALQAVHVVSVDRLGDRCRFIWGFSSSVALVFFEQIAVINRVLARLGIDLDIESAVVIRLLDADGVYIAVDCD